MTSKSTTDVAPTEVDVEAAAVADQSLNDLIARALGYVKTTISFESSNKNYGNGDSVHISRQMQFDPNSTEDEWLDQARALRDSVQALAYESLGIQAARDESGVIVRLNEQRLMEAVPGSTRVPEDDVATTAVVPFNPPHTKEEVDDASDAIAKAMRKENTEWAKDRYYGGFEREFYDNRESNAAKGYDTAPDFKHKTHKHVGFWLPKDR